VPTEDNTTYTSDAQSKAKLYYRSCLDKNDTIEKLGAKPLIDFLELINGWNVTGNKFNASTWSLQNTVELLHCK
jgi:membrane metallo-endopeptidase-like protein 1